MVVRGKMFNFYLQKQSKMPFLLNVKQNLLGYVKRLKFLIKIGGTGHNIFNFYLQKQVKMPFLMNEKKNLLGYVKK